VAVGQHFIMSSFSHAWSMLTVLYCLFVTLPSLRRWEYIMCSPLAVCDMLLICALCREWIDLK